MTYETKDILPEKTGFAEIEENAKLIHDYVADIFPDGEVDEVYGEALEANAVYADKVANETELPGDDVAADVAAEVAIVGGSTTEDDTYVSLLTSLGNEVPDHLAAGFHQLRTRPDAKAQAILDISATLLKEYGDGISFVKGSGKDLGPSPGWEQLMNDTLDEVGLTVETKETALEMSLDWKEIIAASHDSLSIKMDVELTEDERNAYEAKNGEPWSERDGIKTFRSPTEREKMLIDNITTTVTGDALYVMTDESNGMTTLCYRFESDELSEKSGLNGPILVSFELLDDDVQRKLETMVDEDTDRAIRQLVRYQLESAGLPTRIADAIDQEKDADRHVKLTTFGHGVNGKQEWKYTYQYDKATPDNPSNTSDMADNPFADFSHSHNFGEGDPFYYLPEKTVEELMAKIKLAEAQEASAAELQRLAELTYDITIGPAEAETVLSPSEVTERFEVDHVVKIAPEFSRQVQDVERTNMIVRIAGQSTGLATHTSGSSYAHNRQTNTEHEVLAGLQAYLQAAESADGLLNREQVLKAREMLDTLTFIGKKEYDEATQGIAEYWKTCLDANPDLQILALATIGDGADMIKSDEYLLDNILGGFSMDELEKYAGRLITSATDVKATTPGNLKVVLLDDWTISGSQLSAARNEFLNDYPNFESSVEVQLLTANRKRIERGLEYGDYSGPMVGKLASPVRAYYLAHHSTRATKSAAHITGSHSSVDYDAENDWSYMTSTVRASYRSLTESQKILQTMPMAANIVRPYRMEGVTLMNKAFLEEYNRRMTS